MLLEQIEQRLESIEFDGKPLFSGVDQIIDPQTIVDANTVKKDAAFVVPVSDGADPNERTTGRFSQLLRPRFGILIVCRAVNDRMGKGVTKRLEFMKQQIRGALMGWTPDTNFEPIMLVEGNLLEFKRGGVFWMEEYVTETLYEGQS